MVVEDSQKTLKKGLNQLLVGHVLSSLLDFKFDSLYTKNHKMVSLFNECSNTFGPLSSSDFTERYFASSPERTRL